MIYAALARFIPIVIRYLLPRLGASPARAAFLASLLTQTRRAIQAVDIADKSQKYHAILSKAIHADVSSLNDALKTLKQPSTASDGAKSKGKKASEVGNLLKSANIPEADVNWLASLAANKPAIDAFVQGFLSAAAFPDGLIHARIATYGNIMEDSFAVATVTENLIAKSDMTLYHSSKFIEADVSQLKKAAKINVTALARALKE